MEEYGAVPQAAGLQPAASSSSATGANPQQPRQTMQQAQEQQHYPQQGLKGGWQSDMDYQERQKMIAKIVHLLQQRKPNAQQEWLGKLPLMAKRLEVSLYESAESFEQYNDTSTLKHRLQQLAVSIGKKTKKTLQAQMTQAKKLADSPTAPAPAAAKAPAPPALQQLQPRPLDPFEVDLWSRVARNEWFSRGANVQQQQPSTNGYSNPGETNLLGSPTPRMSKKTYQEELKYSSPTS